MKTLYGMSSPNVRKVLIALAEKGLPCELVWDIPWHADTSVAEYNPLEQLPILLADPATALPSSTTFRRSTTSGVSSLTGQGGPGVGGPRPGG